MNNPFEKLSLQWFAKHGAKNPQEAMRLWNEWITKHPGSDDKTQYRKKVLQFASGLSESSVRHYLSGRGSKLGEQTLSLFDAISVDLGYTLPERPQLVPRPPKSLLNIKRIAFLTELSNIPSPPYHMEVIRGVIKGSSRYHVSTSLHEVSPLGLSIEVANILDIYRPDGIIILRIKPDEGTLDVMRKYNVPACLIHADKDNYPSPPVLANIVPDQEPIRKWLELWIKKLMDSRELKINAESDDQKDTVILISTPLEGTPGSIRDERIYIIMKTLDELKVKWEHYKVDNYSFRHAYPIFEKFRNAKAYIALCDEIAVALKDLLAADGQDYKYRILGFDDSQLAKDEGITSFGQHLDEIGELATEKLVQWLERDSKHPNAWPDFHEEEVDIRLTLRD